jgi:hypothetical protein
VFANVTTGGRFVMGRLDAENSPDTQGALPSINRASPDVKRKAETAVGR